MIVRIVSASITNTSTKGILGMRPIATYTHLFSLDTPLEGEGSGPYAEVDNVNGQKDTHEDQKVPHLEWLGRGEEYCPCIQEQYYNTSHTISKSRST